MDARSPLRDLHRRADAWTAGDARSLVAAAGALPLLGPGLDEAVHGDDRVRYLELLFDFATLRLEPGVAVGDTGAAYQEWEGTARGSDAETPFRLVEGIRPAADGQAEWILFFDTWHTAGVGVPTGRAGHPPPGEFPQA
jgi:hypothetical protein